MNRSRGASENLNSSDDGRCGNFRGHMPQRCGHRVHLAWRPHGSGGSSRCERLCLVLDLSRERGNRSCIAGVVGGTKSQGRRRCLGASRFTRPCRRRRCRAVRSAPASFLSRLAHKISTWPQTTRSGISWDSCSPALLCDSQLKNARSPDVLLTGMVCMIQVSLVCQEVARVAPGIQRGPDLRHSWPASP